MTTARDIMTPDPVCVRASDTVREAAAVLRDRSVGSLPVIGEDGDLIGMVTDRDIVVDVIAAGKEPRSMHVGEIVKGTPVTVDADADVTEVMRTMMDHQVRRLPVLGGQRIVGVVAQADVARAVDTPAVGDLLEALSHE
jgi:CBS domain-containing protein